MKHTIPRALDIVYLACMWIAGLSIVVMSLIIPMGVFARYVLGFGAQWPEPIAILLMVVFTFLGGAVAYRAGSHIAVAMLTDRLPKPLQGLCGKAVDVLMLITSLFMLVYGAKLCLETMNQTLTALPWLPVGYTYMPVPLGGLVTLLFVLEKLAFGPQTMRPVVIFEHLTEEQGA